MRILALALIATPALADEAPVVPHFLDETATAGLATSYTGE